MGFLPLQAFGGNASFSSVNQPGLIFAKWPVAFARSFSTWGVGQTWRLLFQTGAQSSLFPSVPVRSLQSCPLIALGTAHLWVLRSLGTGIERCIPSPRSYLWRMGAFVPNHRFIPTHLNFLLRKQSVLWASSSRTSGGILEAPQGHL